MAREAKKKQSTKLIALSSTNKAYEFRKPLEKKIKYQGKEVDIKLHEDPKGFSYIVWKNKKYMLDVIEKNLSEAEAGLLILKDEDRAKLQFPKDIEVFLITPPSYDGIMRWFRERMMKREKNEE